MAFLLQRSMCLPHVHSTTKRNDTHVNVRYFEVPQCLLQGRIMAHAVRQSCFISGFRISTGWLIVRFMEGKRALSEFLRFSSAKLYSTIVAYLPLTPPPDVCYSHNHAAQYHNLKSLTANFLSSFYGIKTDPFKGVTLRRPFLTLIGSLRDPVPTTPSLYQ
jgi:hypothetical protein